VNQVKMKVAERLGVLGLFLNKRRGPTWQRTVSRA
jgi:hypothetical protein